MYIRAFRPLGLQALIQSRHGKTMKGWVESQLQHHLIATISCNKPSTLDNQHCIHCPHAASKVMQSIFIVTSFLIICLKMVNIKTSLEKDLSRLFSYKNDESWYHAAYPWHLVNYSVLLPLSVTVWYTSFEKQHSMNFVALVFDKMYYYKCPY